MIEGDDVRSTRRGVVARPGERRGEELGEMSRAARGRPPGARPSCRARPARPRRESRPDASRRRGACARRAHARSSPAGPASSEPTGAQSPLERHAITVVAGAAYSAALVPVATTALKSRAPSRCRGRSPMARASALQVLDVPGHAARGHVGVLHRDDIARGAGGRLRRR